MRRSLSGSATHVNKLPRNKTGMLVLPYCAPCKTSWVLLLRDFAGEPPAVPVKSAHKCHLSRLTSTAKSNNFRTPSNFLKHSTKFRPSLFCGGAHHEVQRIPSCF